MPVVAWLPDEPVCALATRSLVRATERAEPGASAITLTQCPADTRRRAHSVPVRAGNYGQQRCEPTLTATQGDGICAGQSHITHPSAVASQAESASSILVTRSMIKAQVIDPGLFAALPTEGVASACRALLAEEDESVGALARTQLHVEARLRAKELGREHRPGPCFPPAALGSMNCHPAARHTVGRVPATGEAYKRPAHHDVGTKPRRTSGQFRSCIAASRAARAMPRARQLGSDR